MPKALKSSSSLQQDAEYLYRPGTRHAPYFLSRPTITTMHDEASTSASSPSPTMSTSTTLLTTGMTASASSSAAGRAGAMRANPLHRGEACLTCRRRKMKCDAGKPSCGPCTRAGKRDECEYEESRFVATISRLEDEVRVLQGRVRELEHERDLRPPSVDPAGFTAFLPPPAPPTPSDADAPYALASQSQPPPPQYHHSHPQHLHQHHQQQHPHHLQQQQQQHQHQPQALQLQLQVPPSPAPASASEWPAQSPSQSPGNAAGLGLHTKIQPDILQRLLGMFIPRAHQFALPPSSVPLPQAGALTEAACAVACALALPDRNLAVYESIFILRAEAALARAAPAPSSRDIQAGLLLAGLAFSRGRPLEGARALGAAGAVARAMHLRSTDRDSWTMLIRVERTWLPYDDRVANEDEDVFSPVVKQEHEPYDYPQQPHQVWPDHENAQSIGVRSAVLAARAWALFDAAAAAGGEPQHDPRYWQTRTALERLLSVLPSYQHAFQHAPGSASSAAVLASAALVALGSQASVLTVALTTVRDLEWPLLDLGVGGALARVLSLLHAHSHPQEEQVVRDAVERVRNVMPYVDTLLS